MRETLVELLSLSETDSVFARPALLREVVARLEKEKKNEETHLKILRQQSFCSAHLHSRSAAVVFFPRGWGTTARFFTRALVVSSRW